MTGTIVAIVVVIMIAFTAWIIIKAGNEHEEQ